MKGTRKQPKRNLRAKKTEFKKYLNELSHSSDEESSHIDMVHDYGIDGSEESSLGGNLRATANNQRSNSKVSRVQQRRNRKLSNDSTLDGSQAHKNRKGFNTIEASRFLKKPQSQTPNPNFDCLVRAVKACGRLDKAKDDVKNCASNTTVSAPISCVNDLVSKMMSGANNISTSLNLDQDVQRPIICMKDTSKVLNLNGLSNGSNVNVFFENLREELSNYN